ncbi:hypothetical protein CR152_11475 [Massilia violaceinigra]|uniref:Rhodanese domain-containing protein n=1 Tax=Massilia violaceinigra TaxID=2045208 RepID=A0A2D2DJD1_9BURK|nr:hypothetical protein [Massilia violaceinigra]ATQ75072.1 hypothetical protein CR152_11475 [Massilia violaceinigra]
MQKREKLTLAWRGATTRVPDIVFVDVTEDNPPPALKPIRVATLPPIARNTVQQEHYENVVRLLDGWADWIRTGEPLAEGAPRQCLGAPDARIHSFEDMEIEVNKRLVREVHTAIWELNVIEREAVMTHYGLQTRGVWRANFNAIFDQAVDSLFGILKSRVAC